MPTPRFTSAVGQTETVRVTISEEVIEGVVAGPAPYVIKGWMIPATGIYQGKVGDKVKVLWRGGKPTHILAHDFRRGHPPAFPEARPIFVNGVVEELLVSNDDAGRPEVFFRNSRQYTALNIQNLFAFEPDDCGWGMNSDAFWVHEKGTYRFHVFRLARLSRTTIMGDSSAIIQREMYVADLRAVTIPVTSVTFRFARNSQRPYILGQTELVDNNVPIPVCNPNNDIVNNLAAWNEGTIELQRNDDTMEMLRPITVTLQNMVAVFSETYPGLHFGGVTPFLAGALLDENDELLVMLRLDFSGFGGKTSEGIEYPGLTGGQTTFQEVFGGQYPICPIQTAQADPDPTFGPTTNIFNITETHSHLIRARDGAVIWTTLLPSATRTVEHTKNGVWQFNHDAGDKHSGAIRVQLDRWKISNGFIVDTPTCVIQDHPPAHYEFMPLFSLPPLGGFLSVHHCDPNCVEVSHQEPIDTATGQVFSPGYVGNVGIVSLEANLFNAFLAGIVGNDQDITPQETIDGFLAADGNVVPHVGFRATYGPLINDQSCAPSPRGPGTTDLYTISYTGTWTIATGAASSKKVDKVKTYQYETYARPYFSKAGQIYQFVVIHERALRPTTWNDGETPLAGHESDPSYFTVLVTVGASRIIIRPRQAVASFDPASVELLSGSERHVMWRLGSDFYISDVSGGTKFIGNNAFAPDVVGLRLTGTDYMESLTKMWFVRWKLSNGEVFLSQLDVQFPPKDTAYDDLGSLIELPASQVSTNRPSVQVVIDPAVLAPTQRNGQ